MHLHLHLSFLVSYSNHGNAWFLTKMLVHRLLCKKIETSVRKIIYKSLNVNRDSSLATQWFLVESDASWLQLKGKSHDSLWFLLQIVCHRHLFPHQVPEGISEIMEKEKFSIRSESINDATLLFTAKGSIFRNMCCESVFWISYYWSSSCSSVFKTRNLW